jgi:hypothetical protein
MLPVISQPTGNPSDPPHNRWQFSLRGLLVFTVSVAIGAAVMQQRVREILGFSAPPAVQEMAYGAPAGSSHYRIEQLFSIGLCGILLVILAFWMIAGMLNQVRDMRSTLASHPDLRADHRWGLQFEISWRLIMALMVSLCILMVFLSDQRLIVLPESPDVTYSLIGPITHAVPAVLVLAIVASVPYVRRKESSSLVHRGLYLMFCALAAALCLELWTDHTIIYQLVHIAVN